MEHPRGLIPTLTMLINLAEKDKDLILGIEKKNFVKNRLKQILTNDMIEIIDPILDNIIDGLIDIANNKIKLFKKSKFYSCIK
jgi:hypothetical protein